MPAYGTKSEPPRKAVKEMMAKHSEDSSKDALHRGVRLRKAKAKRASNHRYAREKLKLEDRPEPEITGSPGTGKQSTPSKDLFPSNLQLTPKDVLSLRDIIEAQTVSGVVGAGKTRPAKRSKKQKDRK